MASHMGVQTYATQRNEQVEILNGFILREWTKRLLRQGLITAQPDIFRQKHFERDDCSDVFDHFLELELAVPIGALRQGDKVQLWAQTTTYKGNIRGKPEPNKTYEIRETLVEALGLRRWLMEEDVPFRTVHFTIGSENYTYDWVKIAKQNAFDLSLYPNPSMDMEAVFQRLWSLFDNVTFEYEYYEQLEAEAADPSSMIGQLVKDFSERLYNWFTTGAEMRLMANRQAELLTQLRQLQANSAERAIRESREPGSQIKKQVIALLTSEDTDHSDPAMLRTLTQLLERNPFLSVALEAESDWERWALEHFMPAEGVKHLSDYVKKLWNAGERERLINRRLLLRIHARGSVNYVQDTGIAGLTEHNLYAGTHTERQVQAISEQVVDRCRQAGILTPEDLYSELASERGRQLVRDARRFEARNGTNIRPSLSYVVEVLSDKFRLRRFRETKLPSPVAYHEAFGRATVRPYQNFQVVLSKRTGRPLAILKVKYFSRREFARRCKEEAYVGFTTKFRYVGSTLFGQGAGCFEERYKNIPLIMFVDMDEDFDPPVYAVRRLVTAGWEAFFDVRRLEAFVADLERQADV